LEKVCSSEDEEIVIRRPRKKRRLTKWSTKKINNSFTENKAKKNYFSISINQIRKLLDIYKGFFISPNNCFIIIWTNVATKFEQK
jgi:hypothetical protein